jgi:succinate-acetate transporter protein
LPAQFYGGLCQLLAGMHEFRRKNTFAAAAFSSYGATVAKCLPPMPPMLLLNFLLLHVLPVGGFWMSFSLIGICSAVSCCKRASGSSLLTGQLRACR